MTVVLPTMRIVGTTMKSVGTTMKSVGTTMRIGTTMGVIVLLQQNISSFFISCSFLSFLIFSSADFIILSIFSTPGRSVRKNLGKIF